VTTNPSIFGHAILEGDEYRTEIAARAAGGETPREIAEALMVEDVRRAAETLRPVYDRSGGEDGYVSLEVSPLLARDSEATLAEARQLWRRLDRDNVMIKVPGTREGLPAVRLLIREGINVNVTLIFSLPRYEEVFEAFLLGLEDRAAAGEPVDRLASVASFFLSRMDTLLDPRLEERARSGGPRADLAREMVGGTAIACAKVAYRTFLAFCAGGRFRRLAARGARPQRLLWASTGTKDPARSDVMYVEPLIGPRTVNTMPMATLRAYRDHGDPAPRLLAGVEEAAARLALLPEIGIDLAAAAAELEEDGVRRFAAPYRGILEAIAARSR
jgi:transaldolase